MDPRVHVTLRHLRRFKGASRGLSFLPRQPSASVLNGRHRSRLRGRGLNFEEMRDYLPGDDVRSIDWRATARTGSPHVRVFTEEKDRPALLVVDQRMAMFFGSVLNMKSVTAAEAAAIAAFRFLDQGDRVGGIVFDDETVHEVRPGRSPGAINSLLSRLARMNQALEANRQLPEKPVGLGQVMTSVARLAHHDHLVIVISDFEGADDDFRRKLRGIARHNDLVLVLVQDPLAGRQTLAGAHVIGDGRRQADVDFDNRAIAESLHRFNRERRLQIYDWQKEINLSVLPLDCGQETLPQVRKLLASRAPRRRVR